MPEGFLVKKKIANFQDILYFFPKLNNTGEISDRYLSCCSVTAQHAVGVKSEKTAHARSVNRL